MIDTLFTGYAAWFGVPAVIGTIFFLIRMGLMLAGGAADADVDIDVDTGDLGDHIDPGDAAKSLSIQSVAAFIAGFGWGGLAAFRGFNLEVTYSLLVGVATGAAMVWLLGLLLKALHDLQSSGNIDKEGTVGTEGSVYVRVPARGDGRGQVRVVVNGRQRIYNAVTEGQELTRNTRVRVARVNDDNTLTVTPA
jgi:membrane protein implicated in regulation of membrane protease activity